MSGSGKFAYEFRIGTDGIIQIGWASDEVDFNQLGGWGVGDDENSYAYDGCRTRKWHGNYTGDYAYGTAWEVNDIVTCLLDLSNGTMSFLLNNKDLGVAFTGIDATKTWYPAASFTENQYGEFKFGGVFEEMEFKPNDFSYLPRTFPSGLPQRIQSPPHSFLSLTSVSFYFEIAVQISERYNQNFFQVGLYDENHMLILAVDFYAQKYYIIETINAENEASSILNCVNDSDPSRCKEIKQTISMENQNSSLKVFGAGINQNENFVFFTYNGDIIGNPLLVDMKWAVPYLKDISSYRLNFGKSEFVMDACNNLFSPTLKSL